METHDSRPRLEREGEGRGACDGNSAPTVEAVVNELDDMLRPMSCWRRCKT